MDITEKTLFVYEVLGVQVPRVVSSCKLSTEGSEIKVFALGGQETLYMFPRFQRGKLRLPEALQSKSSLVFDALLKCSKAVNFSAQGVFATNCTLWFISCFRDGAEY